MKSIQFFQDLMHSIELPNPMSERNSCHGRPQLMEGTTINFPRSLVRLAWILQHAVTLLPMASDIQAVLNSQTAE